MSDIAQTPDIAVTLVETELVLLEIATGQPGPQGPVGPIGPGGVSGTTYKFAAGDASPQPIYTVPTGKAVTSIGIEVLTPFSGGGSASVRLGTLDEPDKLFAADEIDLSQLCLCEKGFANIDLQDEALILSITVMGYAVAGNARIQITTIDTPEAPPVT